MSFPQTQRFQSNPSFDTFKPSTDNLVDHDVIPYSQNAQHKSYVLDTSPVCLIPLFVMWSLQLYLDPQTDPKGDFDDDDDDLTPRMAYPPLPSQAPPEDRRKWWQKVRVLALHEFYTSSSHSFLP
jgi:hypothetical protein